MVSRLIEGLIQYMHYLDREGLHYDETEAREHLEPVVQLEAAVSVLHAQLEKHREHPHAPILGGGGVVKCACYGCNLARRALAAFGGKK